MYSYLGLQVLEYTFPFLNKETLASPFRLHFTVASSLAPILYLAKWLLCLLALLCLTSHASLGLV